MMSLIVKHLFNLKERFFHRITPQEKELIDDTHLFSKISPEKLKQLYRELSHIRYSKGELVCKEGEVGDSLYIIVNGAVRVFTYSREGEKVSLARLDRGDYFGEQALLGEVNRTRNANVEAIEETTLIKIGEKVVQQVLNVDISLRDFLRKKGFEQFKTILSEATGFYHVITPLISRLKEPKIIEYSKGDEIFHVGDEADYAYLIMQGEIQILVPDKQFKHFERLTLKRGHLFGELGVIKSVPRAASAVAAENVRLCAIGKSELEACIEDYPQFKEVFGTLQKVYQIPMTGAIERYTGNLKGLGPVITTVYNLEDGRTVICSRLIGQNSFTMMTSNTKDVNTLTYEDVGESLKLYFSNTHIVGIESIGLWDLLPELCRCLLDKEPLDEESLKTFSQKGEIKLPAKFRCKSGEKLACPCLSVSCSTVKELIDQGVRGVDGLADATGATTSCGACKPRILDILGES